MKQNNSFADRLLKVDGEVRSALLPYRDSRTVKVVSLLSDLGDQPQMLTLSGAVLALGLVRSDRRMVQAGGRMIASHLLATSAKSLVKHNVDRTRPRSAHRKEDRKPKPGHADEKEENSFPSGHAAGAIAVARAFAREYPEHASPALTGAGAISAAQIVRCAHYPTDVAAGVAIGWLSELAVDRAARLLLRFAPAAPAGS